MNNNNPLIFSEQWRQLPSPSLQAVILLLHYESNFYPCPPSRSVEMVITGIFPLIQDRFHLKSNWGKLLLQAKYSQVNFIFQYMLGSSSDFAVVLQNG
jgi:hypothetical protein